VGLSERVTIDFSRFGKPTDSAPMESLNEIFPEEWDAHRVYTLLEAMQRIEGWRALFDSILGKIALNFKDAEAFRDRGFVRRTDVDSAPVLCRCINDERMGIALGRHFRSREIRLRHCHVADGFRQLIVHARVHRTSRPTWGYPPWIMS